MTIASVTAETELRCGFCGRKAAEVKKLIISGVSWTKPPAPKFGICDDCVETCMHVWRRRKPSVARQAN